MSHDTMSPSTHCRTTRGPRGEGRLTVLGIVAVCVTGGALHVPAVRANETKPLAAAWQWTDHAKKKELPERSLSALAQTGDGVWSESEASRRVQRFPRIYETAWFQIACGLSLVGLAFAAHAVRTRAIRANNALLQVAIDRRKRTEAALRESEGRLRQVVENIDKVIWLTDWTKRKVIYVSPSYETMFGRTCQSLYDNRRSWLECVHPDDRLRIDRCFAKSEEQGKYVEKEYRIVHSDGDTRWILDRSFPIYNEVGDVCRFVGIAEDITKRKRAEMAMHFVAEGVSADRGDTFFESLVRHLASALDVSHVLVAAIEPTELDEARTIAVWAQDRLADNFLYGLTDGLTGTPCGNVAQQQVCLYERDVASLFPEDKILRGMDAESYAGAPLIDSNGRIMGLLAILDTKPMSDPAFVKSLLQVFSMRAAAELERQQSEQALRKSERRLNDFFENAAVGLHWLGSDGIILRANRTVLEMLGYTREEYVGHHITEFHSDAEVVQEILNKLAEGETLHDCEARLRAKDGSIRHVLIDSNVLWEDGRFIHTRCIIRDITERKLAQEQARHRGFEMAHAARLATIGEMAAGMAHELNQPLSAIVNFAAAGRRNLSSGDCDPSRLTHSLERIEAIAEDAGKLIRRVRGLAQKREHASSSVDLNQLIRETVELVAHDIRLAMITMQFEAEEQMPLVQADPVEIQQVVLNLLRNAIEAMKDGGHPPHELCVRTSCVNLDEAEIAVSDTGPGVPSELANRLFDPFVTSKPDGLGIGLSISRRIVEAHGGRLWVGSNPGRGSTFYVTLPIGCKPDGRSDRYRSVSQNVQEHLEAAHG